jgi:hypothetical protein
VIDDLTECVRRTTRESQMSEETEDTGTTEATEQTDEEPPFPTDAPTDTPTGDTPDDDAPAGEGEDAKGYSIDSPTRPKGNTWTKGAKAEPTAPADPKNVKGW